MARPRTEAPRRLGSIAFLAAAGGAPLALYVATMAPTVYGMDSAELTTGAYLLGIVHPPGSPAYLLLGHVFSWLPIGDVGYRLNLLSAVASATSIVLVCDIVRRLTGDRALALATGWFAATGYYVWAAAVAAEVYALQGCVVVGLIDLALLWRSRQRAWQLFLLCFAAGVGVAVHPSVGLLAPGVAMLLSLADARPWTKPRLLLGAALCALAGASVYFYLPLRHLADLPLDPARDYWNVDLASADGMWWMVSARAFRRHFFRVGASGWDEIGRYAYLLWSNFLGLGAIAGLAGLCCDFSRRPWLHGSLLLMLAGHLGFFVFYGAGDREMMFLPTYLIWSVWVGLGVRWLVGRLGSGAGSAAVAAALLLVMSVFGAARNYRMVDLSRDWSARERGASILAALERDAVYFGSWGDLRIVEYLQHVEGERKDVTTVDLVFAAAAERQRRVAASLESGRPVYSADCLDPPAESLRCEPVAGCDCYRLRPLR